MKVCLVWSFINSLAAKIVDEHPTYHLFTDNCQDFGQYLVEAICGEHVLCPATIQKILNSLFVEKDSHNFPKRTLPGTYPQVLLPLVRSSPNADVSPFFSPASYHTATPQSYYTATPHSYYTATPHSYYTTTPRSYISASSPRDSDDVD